MSKNDNNNNNLTELVKETQKTSRITAITGSLSALTTAITSGILIWKSLKRDKIDPAIRLIRQKGRIEKVKLRQEAEMTRELLTLEILEQEAKHEAKVKEFEVGLEKKEEQEILSGNLLNKLKNKGQEIFTKKTGDLKEKVDQLKDKIPHLSDEKKTNK